jgi:hypothetical protein
MKKLLAFVFSFCLMFLPFFSVEAASNPTSKDLQAKFKVLQTKYNIEQVDIQTIPKDKILHFNSMEEFQTFVEDLKSHPKDFSKEISVSTGKSSILGIPFSINQNTVTPMVTANYYDSDVISWWAPFSGWGMTGLACWHNVSFEYQWYWFYGHPRFSDSSVTNIDSYLTGLNVAWWQQTSKSYNLTTTYYTNDTARFRIYGNYVLGVDISGFTLGAKISDSWTCSLRIY